MFCASWAFTARPPEGEVTAWATGLGFTQVVQR